jgi:hypothetical protein
MPAQWAVIIISLINVIINITVQTSAAGTPAGDIGDNRQGGGLCGGGFSDLQQAGGPGWGIFGEIRLAAMHGTLGQGAISFQGGRQCLDRIALMSSKKAAAAHRIVRSCMAWGSLMRTSRSHSSP